MRKAVGSDGSATVGEIFDPRPDNDHLRLHDPLHLMYLANFAVDPFSLGGDFGGYLLLRNDGHAKLLYDNRLARFGRRRPR